VRRAFPWLLALLGYCAAAQADPRELVNDCIAHLPAGATGIEALEPLCPGLGQAISELSGGATLAAASLKRLDHDGLVMLMSLTAAPTAHSVAPPDPAAVAAILREFTKAPAHQLGWWERFKAWCLKWFAPASRNAPSVRLPAWLSKFSLSQAVATALFYSLLGLLVIAVLWMVRNELRAAGLLGRSRAGPNNTRPSFAGSVSASLSLERVLKTPLAQRPALLFRLLAGELSRQGRLTAEASLTHREVAARARLDDATEREQLNQLSHLAELQLYGSVAIEPARSEGVLAEGQALYVRLRRRPMGAA
jgi:hypothetical protein